MSVDNAKLLLFYLNLNLLTRVARFSRAYIVTFLNKELLLIRQSSQAINFSKESSIATNYSNCAFQSTKACQMSPGLPSGN
jgi:hypothetical protein